MHGHRYINHSPLDKENDFKRIFNIKRYESFITYIDYIILSMENVIKLVDLYEMIWGKYMYYLDSQIKYESSLWRKPYSGSGAINTKDLINQSNTNLNFNIFNDNSNYNTFTIIIFKNLINLAIFVLGSDFVLNVH